MHKPHLVSAVIGNSKMLATMDKSGQLHRLWWPNIDYPQHINQFWTGVYVEGKTHETMWLHGDGWQHRQQYLGDTAVVETLCISHYLGLQVSVQDFCPPGEDLMIKTYRFQNLGQVSLPVTLVCLSNLEMAEFRRCNTVYYESVVDGLIHYGVGYYFGICSDWACTGYQAGGGLWDAADGRLEGNSVGMGTDGALTWALGDLEPGQEKVISLFLVAGDTLEQVLEKAEIYRRKGADSWLKETQSYWQEYLNRAKPITIHDSVLAQVYRRSLITFKLLSDEEHGGILAAPEIDEHYLKCGGYGYCWGRDAAYITVAMEKAGYPELARKFYHWARKAQSPDGSWHQRHFINGHYAPAWGFQVDETGSILWGIWHHYQITGDEEFVRDFFPCIEKGAQFLIGFLDEETNLAKPSYDLWEERIGEHTYSSAAVYGGLMGAAQLAEGLGRLEEGERWRSYAALIKKGVENLYRPELGRFLRGVKRQIPLVEYQERQARGEQVLATQNPKGYFTYYLGHDETVDVSLLGLSVPFGLLDPGDESLRRTVEKIEECLTSPVGGIKRYENDNYIGGNPWLLTTMWLGLYYCRLGQGQKAKELLMWAAGKHTELFLLPEQADKHTGEPAWVIPLTWSHAMLVLLIWELFENGIEV
ncbi:MAG: glycoside hydrolase family 15 protein [Clostridia bacterium]|nr:glycoside hydrolase family 15 protein [Clostridia bacterium]